MTKKIGLITYHSAYNFGSVLQALATQMTIKKLGYSTEIVDYRPTEGDYFYKHFFFRHQPLRFFITDLPTALVIPQRQLRQRRFEEFISRHIALSPGEYKEPEDLNVLHDTYSLMISGSDQIINKHSNELITVDWKYMDPYLLAWFDGPKISYASSPASMTDEELEKIAPQLRKFDELSAREQDAAGKLSKLTGRPVATVCDPTLLMDGKEWEQTVNLPVNRIEGDYVLYYSLKRPRVVFKEIMPQLKRLRDRTGCKIAIITPLAGFIPSTKGFVNCLDAGPAQFLSLVKHARTIITDSSHGTLFSINFRKPFWTLDENAQDSRKMQILSRIGLNSRIIPTINDVPDSFDSIDFGDSHEHIEHFRDHSIDYLRSAIEHALESSKKDA
ncbi:polysaccharide pyruvyl transferase family protein [Corynebacterium stationis]|uniref:polysaccharide pyruvyl transferase family protein n=1 Tax=Corynebacterium stationis TaxID=1705 RepID=UPI00321FF6E2